MTRSHLKHQFDSIAFCGGCAKGAFQIGAWAALEDLGLTRSIRTVSGTSIGGLNAVLFALGDLNRAKEIWNSVREDTAFTGFGNKGKSLFSRGGLRRILNHLDLQKLKYCGIDVYCNIHDTQTDQVVSKRINDLSKEEQIDVLLATSAMPGFYEPVKIDGHFYHDGGWTKLGNMPIESLYKVGCRNILLLSLDENFGYNKTNSLKISDIRQLCKDAELFVISPLEPLDDSISKVVLPDLDFSQRAIQAKMITGYVDAKKELIGEDIYMMKNDYVKINACIRTKMTNMFSRGREIEQFIKTTNFSWYHWEVKPLIQIPGAFTDIFTLRGWRVQQSNIFKDFYRFLNPDSICKAYTWNPNDIINALDNYEAALKLMNK